MTERKSSRVVAVIQARTGSSRLPGKVLRELAGRPVLEWVLRAAMSARGIDEVVIATSSLPDDDVIGDFGRQKGVHVVRGSEADVLSRFLQAAEETNADAIVRLTADCPLLDPAVISQVVALWREDNCLDYVSTTQVRSLPRGLDVELVTTEALRRVDARTEIYHRSHVTSGIYEEGSGFDCGSITFRPGSSHYRVTLDTIEDAALLDAVVDFLPAWDSPPSWRSIVEVLDNHPEIVALNSHVEQKALTEG